MYRYILRESCSQFDSLPLTYLTIPSKQGVPLTSSLPTHAVGGSARRRIVTATTVANALRDGVLLCELAAAVCDVADATPVPKVSFFYLPLHFTRIMLTI